MYLSCKVLQKYEYEQIGKKKLKLMKKCAQMSSEKNLIQSKENWNGIKILDMKLRSLQQYKTN